MSGFEIKRGPDAEPVFFRAILSIRSRIKPKVIIRTPTWRLSVRIHCSLAATCTRVTDPHSGKNLSQKVCRRLLNLRTIIAHGHVTVLSRFLNAFAKIAVLIFIFDIFDIF